MSTSHRPYRPQNPHNKAFYPTPLPPPCRAGLPQGPALYEQIYFHSLLGIDLGVTHAFGRSPQIRWAFNFVAIWCLLHLDPTTGFVAEFEMRCKLSIDKLRKLFPQADFAGFDPGRLPALNCFPQTDRRVASALRKAINRNFKQEIPLSKRELEAGYKPIRVKLDADDVREDLKPTFAMLKSGERTTWVMQPGEWLTPQEWDRVELTRYVLVYAPAQTCKKGGCRVK